MNVTQQLKINAGQLAACFYADRKLAARIVILIITGFCALWFFLVDAVMLWLIKMFQIPGDELDGFINNENRPAVLRCVMLIVLVPIVYIRYIMLPFFYMVYWLCNFLFNCFAFISSVGESGWSSVTYGIESETYGIEEETYDIEEETYGIEED